MDRRTLIVAGAATAASLALAAPAGAQTPVTLTFNHVVLDTPATGDAQLVSPSTQPLTVTADIDPTGAFTVAPSDFNAPTYSFTSPVPGSVTLQLAQPASGTFDATTGALNLTADLLATLTVPGDGSCSVDTGSLTLSTAVTDPLPGTPFPASPTGLSTGAGAFGTSWSTLPAGTGTLCSEIDGYIDGPGGVWISRDITPAQAEASTKPALALKVATPHALNPGGSEQIHVTVSNHGAADTASVKVCLLAPSPLTPARTCKTVPRPKATSTTTLTFKVATPKRAAEGAKAAAKRYDLTVTATGLKTQKVPLEVA